ncbi:structural maintenance of chromosome [Tritrichomonas foetus]|uniref:Structural maintenance of chromosome n=1 Tax=Tritrichomonas foetus TaxID=1144522 RepID=A0A1J4KD11_9EUKA|nr:structural maintenance of chromosome [Tritrichomonas foetus]|eukprot:OHT07588.1 structural maintenance of chromosome [Tritrichomonas foetus]
MSEISLEYLKNSLDNTHQLTEQAFDRSTVLESFQEKAKELQESHERIIYLETQLKMAKEAQNLQLAEFSFQRSEYEAEIEACKKTENELRDALFNQSNKIMANSSIDIQLEKGKAQSYQHKYQKWKKRAHDLQNKKKSLKAALKTYDTENKKLKSENTELQSQLDSQNQLLSQEQLNSFTLSNETENYSRKLQKTESKTEKLMENNRLLTGQLKQLTAENGSFRDQIKSLKDDIRSLRKQIQEEAESFQVRFKQLASEKSDVDAKLRQAKTDLKKRELEIRELIAENNGNSSSNNEIIAKLESLDEENQKLKLKNKSLQTKQQKLQGTIEQLQSLQPSLKNCENEMTALCDIIGIDPEDVGQPWTNLTKNVEELINIKKSYQSIKDLNSTLQKRVARLQIEKKTETIVKSTEPADGDEYCETLSHTIDQLKQEIDDVNKQNDNLRRQLLLSHKIVAIHNDLTHQITELHSAIFDSDRFSLRPVIFSVIFGHRFLKLKKFVRSNDAHSLNAFTPRIHIGSVSKLHDIKEKFTSLSQDLVHVKTEMTDFLAKNKNIIESKDAAEFELRNTKDQLAITTRKLEYLKVRMFELQEDLSTLISPETYQDTCQKLAELENDNQQLIRKIKAHDSEIHKKDIIEKNLQEQISQIKIDKKHYRSNLKEMKEYLDKKEKEFDALKSLLREKTKEVLSLERMINRHSKQNQNDNKALQALSTENQEIIQNVDFTKKQKVQFDNNVMSVSMKMSGSGIASIINPTFLQ